MNVDFNDLDFTPPPDEDEESSPGGKLLPVYTADIETDPFEYGRVPKPFCTGFYDGESFHSTWGENCISQMIEQFYNAPPGIIYMHNGGKFDFFFFLDQIADDKLLVINGRIVKGFIKCSGGKHEIRDSYAIMPFALAKYKKDDIDYRKFEANVRELHRDEILKYLRSDCVYLHELCKTFVDTFGARLTIGGTAIKELQKLHTFETLGKIVDQDIRSKFYYGGRVQCFKKGLLHGQWKVFDVNSMYPSVMLNYEHPVDTPEADTTKIRSSTCFISVEGKNYGAFPQREKNGGLRFDIEDGIFHVTRHEYDAAIRHDLFIPRRILRCVNFRHRISFKTFVNAFYDKRNEAKNIGDDIRALFYKFILNSAYGKFAQNPSHYFDYRITMGNRQLGKEWKPDIIYDSMANSESGYIVWKKPSAINTRFNVATAASITGASRAVLLNAIAQSTNPIYCDTDSIVCEALGAEQHASKLGAWKLEAESNLACIAGKKLYALFASDCPSCGNDDIGVSEEYPCDNKYHVDRCVKMAHKGVKVSASDIRRICLGDTIETFRMAPSFKLNGSTQFIKRNVRMH